MHTEAAKAAQSVYDKYTPELNKRILNQMAPGERLSVGMGAANFYNKDSQPFDYAKDFLAVITNIQYWDKCEAGFITNDFEKPLK